MNPNHKVFIKSAMAILGALLVALFLISHSSIIHAAARHARVSLATDWSHHHMVFSAPKTSLQALRLSREPRYLNQWERRNTRRFGPPPRREKNPIPAAKPLHSDWSEFLGPATTTNAINYPAKFSFDLSTADCNNDFVSYTTGAAGSGSQPTIAAFNNLYTGCPTGNVPNNFFAYATGPGTAATAPVLSLDGTKIALVETIAGGATLRLIKFANGDGSWDMGSTTWTVNAPATAGLWTDPACSGATSCMISVPLGLSGEDNQSAPFYDYINDVLYVGDNEGVLHKFTNVFGTVNPTVAPAEALTGGWPVTLTAGQPVMSPVYDGLSGMVIATDLLGAVYEVAPNGSVTSTGVITGSFMDGPVVDGTSGSFYVFANDDLHGNAGVFQFSISGLVLENEATVGPGTSSFPMYAGDFDNSFYASVPAPTGNLYACGNGSEGNAQLYQIPISLGVMSATASALPGGVLTLFPATCGPLTEIFNPNPSTGPTDFIFSSVQTNSVQEDGTCSSGGCIMNLSVTQWQPTTTFVLGQHVLDSNLNMEMVVTPGTSSGVTPTWNATPVGTTADGGVVWINQGPAATFAAWLPANPYSVGNELLDTNGNIEQASVVTGLSGGTQPTWVSGPIGTPTVDNAGAIVWVNLGPAGGLASNVSGGPSGIVVDNFVGAGTLPGTSQIYFITMESNFCATSKGSGGCGVQASQSSLQ